MCLVCNVCSGDLQISSKSEGHTPVHIYVYADLMDLVYISLTDVVEIYNGAVQ